MENIFNCSMEFQLRILLILKETCKPVNIDRILCIDFFTTYGRNYSILPSNLHGDNTFDKSELSIRKNQIHNALQNLVMKNYIQVDSTKTGFLYSINATGSMFIDELSSDYKNEYLRLVKQVLNFTENKTDKELMNYALKGGQNDVTD